jgi:hypothetical protein
MSLEPNSVTFRDLCINLSQFTDPQIFTPKEGQAQKICCTSQSRSSIFSRFPLGFLIFNVLTEQVSKTEGSLYGEGFGNQNIPSHSKVEVGKFTNSSRLTNNSKLRFRHGKKSLLN